MKKTENQEENAARKTKVGPKGESCKQEKTGKKVEDKNSKDKERQTNLHVKALPTVPFQSLATDKVTSGLRD